jgi:hypothetical protein
LNFAAVAGRTFANAITFCANRDESASEAGIFPAICPAARSASIRGLARRPQGRASVAVDAESFELRRGGLVETSIAFCGLDEMNEIGSAGHWLIFINPSGLAYWLESRNCASQLVL